MKQQIAKSLAVLFSGCVLVGGAQAGGFFTKTPPPAFAPQPASAPVPISQTQPPPLAEPGSPTAPSVAPVSATASSIVPASATAPSVAPASAAPKNLPSAVAPSIDAGTVGDTSAQQPRYSIVNHKLVLLSYEFNDIGPSGVSGVEVWVTRDSKGWQKIEGIQRENPVWIELEEGTFGIFLLARTGLGGGREAPTETDQPHMWIQVDLTKPVVFLSGVHQSNGSHTLDMTWTARDDNFGRKPITLSYAQDATGPWMPIAAGIENTGAYTWQIPPSTPSSFYVRVEAVDRAGNVDSSTSPAPVQIDLSQPGVSNIQLRPIPTK
jgi:hypothetical protein